MLCQAVVSQDISVFYSCASPAYCLPQTALPQRGFARLAGVSPLQLATVFLAPLSSFSPPPASASPSLRPAGQADFPRSASLRPAELAVLLQIASVQLAEPTVLIQLASVQLAEPAALPQPASVQLAKQAVFL